MVKGFYMRQILLVMIAALSAHSANAINIRNWLRSLGGNATTAAHAAASCEFQGLPTPSDLAELGDHIFPEAVIQHFKLVNDNQVIALVAEIPTSTARNFVAYTERMEILRRTALVLRARFPQKQVLFFVTDARESNNDEVLIVQGHWIDLDRQASLWTPDYQNRPNLKSKHVNFRDALYDASHIVTLTERSVGRSIHHLTLATSSEAIQLSGLDQHGIRERALKGF